jgi:hypothetical protein
VSALDYFHEEAGMQNKRPDPRLLPDNLLAMSQRLANIGVARAVEEMGLAKAKASFGDQRAQEVCDAQNYEARVNAEIDKRKAAGKYKPEGSRVSQLIADSGQISASKPKETQAASNSYPYPGVKVTVARGYRDGDGSSVKGNPPDRPSKASKA